jgi:hypothetical protein
MKNKSKLYILLMIAGGIVYFEAKILINKYTTNKHNNIVNPVAITEEPKRQVNNTITIMPIKIDKNGLENGGNWHSR